MMDLFEMSYHHYQQAGADTEQKLISFNHDEVGCPEKLINNSVVFLKIIRIFVS